MDAWGFKTSLETKNFEKLTVDEMVSLLINSEWDDRHNRMIERGMTNAKFRYEVSIEQLKFVDSRALVKERKFTHYR